MIKYFYRILKKKFLSDVNNKLDSISTRQNELKDTLANFSYLFQTIERVENLSKENKEVLVECLNILFNQQEKLVALNNCTNKQQGKLIGLNNYADKQQDILINLNGDINKQREDLIELNLNIDKLRLKLDSVLMRQDIIKKSNRKISILFIVHNMYSWDALSLIHSEFKKNENVDIFVLAIDAENAVNDLQNSYSSKTSHFLSNENIRFHKIINNDIEGLISYLHTISPSAIIRQSGWDADIPSMYSALNLSNYNIFYIPYYSLDVIDDFSVNKLNLEYNQNLHLVSNRIYGTSRYFVEQARNAYLGDFRKFQFLGNAKFEYVTRKVKELNNFSKTGILNIIWAPHHSINNQWLSFGTFEKIVYFLISWQNCILILFI